MKNIGEAKQIISLYIYTSIREFQSDIAEAVGLESNENYLNRHPIFKLKVKILIAVDVGFIDRLQYFLL